MYIYRNFFQIKQQNNFDFYRKKSFNSHEMEKDIFIYKPIIMTLLEIFSNMIWTFSDIHIYY
jgi:hypothetical protein